LAELRRVRWLDPVEMQAWIALLEVHARLFALLDEELLRAHGVSLAEYEVLVHLGDAPSGSLRMAELAERAFVSRSGLTRRVDRLQAAGLVRRRTCPTDRRGAFAQITEAGRARLAAAAPTHVEGVRRHLIDLVDRPALETLGRALRAVADDCAAAAARRAVPPLRASGGGTPRRGRQPRPAAAQRSV
jgi:DNA-binding MarR family transcriptional regulator